MLREKKPLVSFITVNYNQWAVTLDMLDSLAALSFEDYEVIVVDNASADDQSDLLLNHHPHTRIIKSQQNLGFAGGNNLGIQASKGHYCFFINNDTLLTEGLTEQLIDLFDQVPNLGVVSPLICYHTPENSIDTIQYAGATEVHPLTARNSIIGEGEPDRGQYNQAQSTAYAHGAAMMIPRRLIDEVGMMPECFFLYYEELDWCEQFKRAGYEIYVEPRAKIYHRESISVGSMSPLKTHYLNRNRILFMRRNRSRREQFLFTLFLMCFTIPKWTLTYMLKGQWDHLQAFRKAITWHFGSQDELNPGFKITRKRMLTIS